MKQNKMFLNKNIKQNFLALNCEYFFIHYLIETVFFEYPQHMFWLRNKKINFWINTVIGRLYHSNALLEN